MKKYQILILVVLNLFIAIGFFVENIGTGYDKLSSDMHNSIPVCLKIDNPSLYQKDLYLYDVNNVKYYTPFYIQTLRCFAACCGGDYLLAIKVFGVCVHLIYGFAWFFFFFKLFKHFVLAVFLSVLIRGIVWLPGLEIWGISDVWTMMPRTLYAAFLPIPFIFLLNKTRNSFLIAAFLIGFIFNFHPITGMGGMLIFGLVLFFYFFNSRVKPSYTIVGIGICLMFLGMIPFLSTYFSQTDSHVVYDVAIYKKAFFKRIPTLFVEPITFIKLWLTPKILFFAAPMVGYTAYAIFVDRKHLRMATSLVAISVLTILFCSVSVYVEQGINEISGLNIRMAFQIIRAQKLAILPGYIALGYLLKILLDWNTAFAIAFQWIVLVFVGALFFAKEPAFEKAPFFGDDIATSVFPNYRNFFKSAEEKQTDIDKMIAYINRNTLPSDVFFGNFIVRNACKRSVVLDGKGASALIEGNPKELIQWYKETEFLKSLSPDQKIHFLKTVKSVNYIMVDYKFEDGVKLMHSEGKYNLYKIL